MRFLFLLGIILHPCGAFAQEFRLSWEAGQVPELYSPLRFRVEIREKGKWVSLEPEEYQMVPAWGNTEKGVFYFKEEQRAIHQGKLDYRLVFRGRNLHGTDSIPCLKAIRIRPYTDSIKPVMAFYIPVEGLFSSGKTYPLDTNTLILRSSSGQIRAMGWTSLPGDSVSSVEFEAVYRHDPSIRTRIRLPIRKHWSE